MLEGDVHVRWSTRPGKLLLAFGLLHGEPEHRHGGHLYGPRGHGDGQAMPAPVARPLRRRATRYAPDLPPAPVRSGSPNRGANVAVPTPLCASSAHPSLGLEIRELTGR